MEVDLVEVGEDSAIVKTFPRKQKHQRMGSHPCQRAYVDRKKKIILARFLKTQHGVSNMLSCIRSFTHEILSFQISKTATRTALVFHSFLIYQLVVTTRKSFSYQFSHFTKANILICFTTFFAFCS